MIESPLGLNLSTFETILSQYIYLLEFEDKELITWPVERNNQVRQIGADSNFQLMKSHPSMTIFFDDDKDLQAILRI